MILVDYTGVALTNVLAQKEAIDIEDINLFRHTILYNLIQTKLKFYREYGDMILCIDRGSSWRKKVFPYYKATRKKAREDDTAFDWKKIFEVINQIFDEILENTGIKCIWHSSAEADDIIAVLSRHITNGKPHIIISNDKDLVQLSDNNIEIYSPMKQQKVVVSDVSKYLFEHIVRGDRSDGVPNIKSKDDFFIGSGRQSSIFAKDVDKWYTSEIPEEYKDNFNRNKKMIDLSEIPEEIQDEIKKKYENYVFQRGDLFDYFGRFKLKNLMEYIDVLI